MTGCGVTTDAFAETNEQPSTIAKVESIKAGDLVMYQYGWCPVTLVREADGRVYVTFRDTSTRTWSAEWKPFERGKRVRVRRRLRGVSVEDVVWGVYNATER